MIKAVYVEDEPRNIDLIKILLKRHCTDTVSLVGTASDIQSAYLLILEKKPDLVYLDIELKKGNAFELLEQIQNSIGIQFQIIFITAFNEYAVKAFRFNALDYLLKPIDVKEFKESTQKAIKQVEAGQTNDKVADAIHQIRQNGGATKIGIPVINGLYFVDHDDIVTIEAKGSYSNIYQVSGIKITCTKNLKVIEKLLPENLFLRVHNSWVINTKHLKQYFKGKNSHMMMVDGSKVPVSIRKKGDFLEKF